MLFSFISTRIGINENNFTQNIKTKPVCYDIIQLQIKLYCKTNGREGII